MELEGIVAKGAGSIYTAGGWKAGIGGVTLYRFRLLREPRTLSLLLLSLL
jgi:hypothetical protein